MIEREELVRWREYVKTRSPRLREAIIRNYAILARRAVDRLQIRPWGCAGDEDLLSYAVIGPIDAVDRYNPEQRVSQLHAKAMLRLSHKLTRHGELMTALAP